MYSGYELLNVTVVRFVRVQTPNIQYTDGVVQTLLLLHFAFI